jgi:hypothetical protein
VSVRLNIPGSPDAEIASGTLGRVSAAVTF